MSLKLKELVAALAQYIDMSSEMQVGAVEFACSRGGLIEVKELCRRLGLRYKQALDLMVRLRRRGLVERVEVRRAVIMRVAARTRVTRIYFFSLLGGL